MSDAKTTKIETSAEDIDTGVVVAAEIDTETEERGTRISSLMMGRSHKQGESIRDTERGVGVEIEAEMIMRGTGVTQGREAGARAEYTGNAVAVGRETKVMSDTVDDPRASEGATVLKTDGGAELTVPERLVAAFSVAIPA